MKKLMFAAAALAAGIAVADITSANIVGYSHATVPHNYSIWGPVFKNVGGGQFYLSQITPCTPKGVPIAKNAKIVIFKLKDDGTYGTSYAWSPETCGGWSTMSDVNTKIGDKEVPLNDGEGFGMTNDLKVNADGDESYAKKDNPVYSPATMRTSGEVDLVCKNVVPHNYSISCNSTPNAIYLSQITPCTPKGVAIAKNAKIIVFKLQDDGTYGTSYAWSPETCGGWSTMSDVNTKIGDKDVPLSSGEGFGMTNDLKVNADGDESYAKKDNPVYSPAVLSLPSPITE